MRFILDHRDRYAGALIALIGIGAIMEAKSYTIGSLQEMGPGFMPVSLGVILLFCGALISFSGSEAADEHDAFNLERADWRGWLCILGGLLWFVIVADRFGMFPGTFGCVAIAAMGDKTMRWRTALLLALAISSFGVLLFAYGLRVQLPAWRW